MRIFYFFSVAGNFLAGMCMIAPFMWRKESAQESPVYALLDYAPFKMGIGVTAFLAGFLKLFSVTPGDIPFAGDFLPAVCGLLGGFSLLYEYYINRREYNISGIAESTPVDTFFIGGRKYLGAACCLFAVLHLLLPGVLFL